MPAFAGWKPALLLFKHTLKRNQERFPEDFAFELTREEILGISQTVISLRKLKFSKQVRAFTEHGALMAANILNSRRAVAMSVYVIRAFVKMREETAANAANAPETRDRLPHQGRCPALPRDNKLTFEKKSTLWP